jgi:hypothetical protein
MSFVMDLGRHNYRLAVLSAKRQAVFPTSRITRTRDIVGVYVVWIYNVSRRGLKVFFRNHDLPSY